MAVEKFFIALGSENLSPTALAKLEEVYAQIEKDGDVSIVIGDDPKPHRH